MIFYDFLIIQTWAAKAEDAKAEYRAAKAE